MDGAVQDYIEALSPEHRPLFDRLHRLVMEEHPDATVVLAYRMPTYQVGRSRLHVGVWRHGLSLYGWGEGRDGGFASRHPDLVTGKGTIRVRPADAVTIPDEELRALPGAVLGG